MKVLQHQTDRFEKNQNVFERRNFLTPNHYNIKFNNGGRMNQQMVLSSRSEKNTDFFGGSNFCKLSKYTKTTVLMLFIVLLSPIHSSFGADWWNNDFENRRKITIAGLNNVLKNQPVIIKASSMLDANQKVFVNSIRVLDISGQEILSQVIRRDTNSGYLELSPNAILTSNDEIIFSVNLNKNIENIFYIYFSEKSKKNASYETDIKTEISDSPFSDFVLYNEAGMKIDIKTSNKGEKVDVAANWCKGTMRMTFHNKALTGIGAYAQLGFPIHSFGTDAKSPKWTKPKLIYDGPVAKTVYTSFAMENNKNVISSGNNYIRNITGKLIVKNYFTMYSNSPIIDYVEVIDYGKMSPSGSIRMTMAFTPGGDGDSDDAMIVPDVMNKSQSEQIRLADIEKSVAEKKRVDIYVNPIADQNMPGYIGWYDTVKKHGIATFFIPPGDKNNNSSLRVNLNVDLLKNKKYNQQALAVNYITYDFYRNNKEAMQNSIAIKIRYTGLSNDIQLITPYDFWNTPEKFITIGKMEKK